MGLLKIEQNKRRIMKLNLKITLTVITVLLTLVYVSAANSFYHLCYLLTEVAMLSTTLLFFIRLSKRREVGLRSIYITLGFSLLTLLISHVARIFWLMELGGTEFAVVHFFKGGLFMPTVETYAVCAVIGILIWFTILFLRMSRKRKLQTIGISSFLLVLISLGAYAYLNRDLSKQDILTLYEIDDLAELKAYAKELDKTLYIDFWHSGCKPCLEEFDAHPEFRELVDTTKVEFFFMGADRSTPGEKQKQRVLIEKYQLKGTHSFVSREVFSTILDEAGYQEEVHGYKAFPHHMIIDAKGEVVAVKAGAPNKETAAILNGLGN